MISVIIPTADRPGPLHRALRSLARQTFHDFEVIAVRDGGQCPQAVIDSWQNDLNVRLLEVEPRQGVSHARNVGLAAASGEYVAFLDDDDIYLPHHLEKAHQVLSGGHTDVVYGGALVSSHWIEAIPRAAEGLPRKDYPFDDGYLAVANYIHTGSVVARSFTASLVRFDEDMSHCEDWDMWLALRRTLGYRFAFLGECTSVYHQVPQRSGAVSAAYRSAPTPFTLARAHLYGKWDAPDALTSGYRDWFRQFDQRLDACIERDDALPEHVYERAVRLLHTHFTAGVPADPAWLDSLFPALPQEPEPTAALSVA
ncbi:glycosyltransferase family 2 protein [Sphaerimonospora cavernae]|uniref:Glycosyltransferase family 2 protein n=1 Tax=Sphaerimonospora cavernae TaxID=1740611 RepID=A0ABV6U1F4_9ACTN